MSLDLVLGRLDALPNVASTDLKAVVEYIDAISNVYDLVRDDVYVSRALLELTNASGYLVGSIVYDADTDLYRFIPHCDQTKEG